MASSVGDLTGRNTPACAACRKLPPSTVISKSAGVLVPSALSFSTNTLALSLTKVILVPVFARIWQQSVLTSYQRALSR